MQEKGKANANIEWLIQNSATNNQKKRKKCHTQNALPKVFKPWILLRELAKDIITCCSLTQPR